MEGNYKWLENEDGSITVLDVEIMGVLGKGERSDDAEVVTRDDLPKFIEVTERIEAKLNRPQTYLLGHNDYKRGKAAPVIGMVERGSRYIDGDWIKARLRVTRPESVEQIKRGELPNRSPEFIKRGPNRGYMWALAATEGLPGHFDDKLPALRLEKMPLTTMPELATLSAEDELATCSLTAPPLTLSPVPSSLAPTLQPNQANAETGMALTKEDLEAIGGVVDSRIDAKLKPLHDKVATLAAEHKDGKVDPDPEGTLAAEARKLVEGEMASLQKQREANDLELERSKAMATLSSETSLTKPAIRKILENVPKESIPFKVEALIAKHGKKDFKLSDDDTIAANGEMAALSREYEQAGGEKALGISQAEYCDMFAGNITEGLGE